MKQALAPDWRTRRSASGRSDIDMTFYYRNMPTIDPRDTLPATLPDDDTAFERDITSSENAVPATAQSEVAIRINLLGKLIIPPSSP